MLVCFIRREGGITLRGRLAFRFVSQRRTLLFCPDLSSTRVTLITERDKRRRVDEKRAVKL